MPRPWRALWAVRGKLEVIRFTRRAYLGRWLRCRYPGGDRPRRNAVRPTWHTAADIRKASQRAREWAYMLDGQEPTAERSDVVDWYRPTYHYYGQP